MKIRALFSASALSLATLAPAWAGASSAGPADCILQGRRVLAVEPYKIDRRYGRFTSSEVRGAEIYVQAEPGLSAEWLQLQLQQRIGQMAAAMDECAFDGDVGVGVTAAGAGYWIRLVASDEKTGKEVLHRAELLLH